MSSLPACHLFGPAQVPTAGAIPLGGCADTNQSGRMGALLFFLFFLLFFF